MSPAAVPQSPASPALPDLRVLLEWQDAGTRVFEGELDRLGPAGLDAPSALPGWSRRHVVAHVGTNADALVNLLYWARTGEETPMYPDPESRDRDIERSAQRPPDEILANVKDACGRYAGAVTNLPDGAWDATVRTAQGRIVAANLVPWLRTREVWVHAIDLGEDATFEILPERLASSLLEDAVALLRTRPGAAHLVLVDDAGEGCWELPGDGAAAVVRGSLHALVAYVLRGQRTSNLSGDGGGVLPGAPRWL